jgi:hypothetical protein
VGGSFIQHLDGYSDALPAAVAIGNWIGADIEVAAIIPNLFFWQPNHFR